MPVGKPDDGFNPNTLSSNQTDVGSGIDRLLMGGGSIFRAGRVIWATGFENGRVTDFNIGGPLTAIVLAPSNSLAAWQGNYMLNLQTQAVLNDVSQMFKYFPGSLQTGKWGLEAMLDIEAVNANVEIVIAFSRVSGIIGAPLTQSAHLRLVVGASNANVKWFVRNAAGVYVQFADLSNVVAINTNAYYNFKWVPDFAQDNNGAFYWNNTRYDLSAVGIQHTAFGVDEKSNFNIQLVNNTAAAQEAFVDNVILTADEP